MALQARILVLLLLASLELRGTPKGSLLVPVVNASFVYSVEFLRELILTPEVTECLKSIPESDIDEYLNLLSEAQARCDRRNVAFVDCMQEFRKLPRMPAKIRNIDHLINSCPKTD